MYEGGESGQRGNHDGGVVRLGPPSFTGEVVTAEQVPRSHEATNI